MVVSSALDLTAYWLPASCLWLVVELWTSKQLEVKVTESCQMFWLPWTIRCGRVSNFTQPGTMWNSAGTDFFKGRSSITDKKWFSKIEITSGCQQKLWLGKWQEVSVGVSGKREPWKCSEEEEREAPRKYSRLFVGRVEHGSQVSTCLTT